MMIQLNPPLPLDTPKGPALAHFLIDYGHEHHLQWVCFQNETGECWTWENPVIQAKDNPTNGRALNKVVGAGAGIGRSSSMGKGFRANL